MKNTGDYKVCDMCKDRLAFKKCDICEKDLCNNCYVKDGWSGNTMDNILLNITMCRPCFNKLKIMGKTEKPVNEELKLKVIEYYKNVSALMELKTKKEEEET